jgi:hypothetical protein
VTPAWAAAALWLVSTGPDAPPPVTPTPAAPTPASPALQPDEPDAPAVDVPGQPPAKISDAYNAAESRLGPLDGTWRVIGQAGEVLYVLQLDDPGGGGDLDGAWRDPRRLGAGDSTGFLAAVRRVGDDLEIRFEGGLFPKRIALKPVAGGGWAGELIHDGPKQAVTMKR